MVLPSIYRVIPLVKRLVLCLCRWYNTFCAEVYQTGAGVFEIFRAYKKAGISGRISL